MILWTTHGTAAMYRQVLLAGAGLFLILLGIIALYHVPGMVWNEIREVNVFFVLFCYDCN